MEILEDQPARSTNKPRPAHKEIIILSSSSENSEGENTASMESRKRPLESPSHDGSVPDKKIRVSIANCMQD